MKAHSRSYPDTKLVTGCSSQEGILTSSPSRDLNLHSWLEVKNVMRRIRTMQRLLLLLLPVVVLVYGPVNRLHRLDRLAAPRSSSSHNSRSRRSSSRSSSRSSRSSSRSSRSSRTLNRRPMSPTAAPSPRSSHVPAGTSLVNLFPSLLLFLLDEGTDGNESNLQWPSTQPAE